MACIEFLNDQRIVNYEGRLYSLAGQNAYYITILVTITFVTFH